MIKAVRPKKSGVWKYFEVDSIDDSRAVCKICPNVNISRGAKSKGPQSYGTSALWAHLKQSHRPEYGNLEKCPSYPPKIPKLIPKARQREIVNRVAGFLLQDASNPMKPSTSDSSEGLNSGYTTFLQKHTVPTLTPETEKMLHLIGEMITLDNQPISILEEKGFQRLMQSILPSDSTLINSQYFGQSILPQLYTRTKQKIMSLLNQSEWLTLSLDIDESCLVGETLVIVTASWIDTDYKMLNFILSANIFHTHPSSKFIDSIFEETLTAWNIERWKVHLIVHENTEKVAKMMPIVSDVPTESFFQNLIQFTINQELFSHTSVSRVLDLCRNFISYFNETRESLDIMNLLHNIPLLKLSESDFILDFTTNWKSTYITLQNIYKHKDYINNLTCFNKLLILTIADWEIADDVIQVLEPISNITDCESNVNLASDIIPSIAVLMRYLYKDQSNIESEVKRTIKEGFENMFYHDYKIEERKPLLLATVLDPRYKLAFISEGNRELTKHWIIQELTEISVNKGNVNSPTAIKTNCSSSSDTKQNILECFAEIASGKIPIIPEQDKPIQSYFSAVAEMGEVEKYLTGPLLPRMEDPLLWWKGNQLFYPKLSQLARRYLSAPLNSFFGKNKSEKLLLRLKTHMDEEVASTHSLNFNERLFLHLNLPFTENIIATNV